jgi:hypothetical protein
VGEKMEPGIVNIKFGIFKNLFYNNPINLSEIIETVNWGSNRVIRQQGFRILPITLDLMPIKNWKLIKDPYFIFEESSYISQPKAQSIIVVHVNCGHDLRRTGGAYQWTEQGEE